jgi:hypothetical protein
MAHLGNLEYQNEFFGLQTGIFNRSDLYETEE